VPIVKRFGFGSDGYVSFPLSCGGCGGGENLVSKSFSSKKHQVAVEWQAEWRPMKPTGGLKKRDQVKNGRGLGF
jgi:hypothetical protein